MGGRYLGISGEMTAQDYLAGIGAQILDANVTIAGVEIDIIALIDGVITFIEVKRRSSARFGRPSEAVTPAKMRRIVRGAEAYLARNALCDRPVRFDVIEILPGEINHIPGAFDASCR